MPRKRKSVYPPCWRCSRPVKDRVLGTHKTIIMTHVDGTYIAVSLPEPLCDPCGDSAQRWMLNHAS